MSILKLRKHQSTFSDEDILINPTDCSGLKLYDVVELKPPKGGNVSNRILLQVRKWPEINQSYPNSVSIKDSAANTHLQLYADVLVNIVDKKDVLVDSIEICFSNAYLARSYMWGLRTHLNNRCVHQRQKLDYLHIRSQICEIWAQGNKVTSGFVDDDTKIVFRSASSLVYLFIQMSSEMWDYDINGDLYCEKAINGFLTDLFDTWRKNDCSHDITIVLFSRTFYDAETLEEFPKEMRECLQVDYKGRFYEDCYRVAFQNDRFDLHDWNTKLTTLKSLFNQYQKEVINRHQEKYSTRIPRAYNSSAAQGNFLEVLNMSLNVFEKHYFDRSFDRTGQLSVVVSPGVGVFEVDFEMTNLTKQRIIDNGIGSDLVCLGEQPLHTVPLLKFNSKSSQTDDNLATCDVYNMPHWINLSFYSSENQVYYSNFVPRIKLPTLSATKQHQLRSDSSRITITDATTTKSINDSNNKSSRNDELITISPSQFMQQSRNQSALPRRTGTSNFCGQQPSTNGHTSGGGSGTNNANNNLFSSHHAAPIPDLVDYDDYDAQVFKSNSMVTYHCQQQQNQQHSMRGNSQAADRSILADMDPNVDYMSDLEDDDEDFMERDNRISKSANIQRRSSDVKNYQEYSRNIRRQTSENVPIIGQSSTSRHSTGQMNGPIMVGAGQQVATAIGQQTSFARMSLKDSFLSDIKIKPESADDLSVRGYNVQSSRLNRSTGRPKALINPFDPSHMTIKLTPNRRRWTHVFPQGPSGTFIQQHHYQPTTVASQQHKTSLPYLADVSPPATILEHEPLYKKSSSSQITSNLQSSQYHLSPGSALSARTGGASYQQHDNNNASSSVISRLSPDYRLQFNGTDAARSALSKLGGGLLRSQAASASAAAAPSTGKSTLVSNETIRFAWCASGEQEWTPAITTGVDWKSLTMPACLPLTTDFFPSQTSLQNDYVIGEYNIDSSCIHSRYTLLEVYRELVCQRLQKGFQIILLPRQTNSNSSSSPSSATNSGLKRQHHHQSVSNTRSSIVTNNAHSAAPGGHSEVMSSKHTLGRHTSSSKLSSGGFLSSSSSSNRHRPSSRANGVSMGAVELADHSHQELERERVEYTMSIGRIFHKLTLNGNTITVTQYRPRHPYPTIKIDYCYRFRAPFHEAYGQSWVHFKSEKLENYSWNYLDNFICARGESYELRNSLKFWRFRVLIMPSKLGLRKLVHSSPAATGQQQKNGSHHHHAEQTTTRHDICLLDYSKEERLALMESFVKLLEIINKTRRASACRVSSSSTASLAGSSSASANANSVPIERAGVEGQRANHNNDTNGDGHQQTSSPSRLIVHIGQSAAPLVGAKNDGLEHQSDGGGDSYMITATTTSDLEQHQQQLCWETINMDIDSALRDAKRSEWVQVQYHNYFDIHQAFELVIKWMVASGAGIAEMVQSWSRKAGNSSVHVVPIPWEPFAMPHSGKADPLRCPLVIELQLNCLPQSPPLEDKQIIQLMAAILRRYGFIQFHDLISTETIERQYVHLSGFAFVALPNLVVATIAGSEAGDGNELSPASDDGPSDSSSSLDALKEQKPAPDQRAKQSDDSTTNRNTNKTKVSQEMPIVVQPNQKLDRLVAHRDTISSPHEEYITRHIDGARQNKTNRLRGENDQVEFIWSWNYMLTKRWRSPSTQDESYAVSLMQDFKQFCANDENRLVQFWLELNELEQRKLP